MTWSGFGMLTPCASGFGKFVILADRGRGAIEKHRRSRLGRVSATPISGGSGLVGKKSQVSTFPGGTSPFFPGILLFRKTTKTLGKWLVLEKNDG